MSAWSQGIAGPDRVLVDTDGDGEVSYILDGTIAQQQFGGNVESWTWTWPGGSATGETPEVLFQVAEAPLTVRLTVEAFNSQPTSTFELDILSVEEGLFTDLSRIEFAESNSTTFLTTVEGDTLVIDPPFAGTPLVYRRTAAGVWVESPFTPNSPVENAEVVDENTLVTGDFGNGFGFQVYRFNGSQWVGSPITFGPGPVINSAQSDFTYEFDSETVVINFSDPNVSGRRVLIYEWNGNQWNFRQEIQADRRDMRLDGDALLVEDLGVRLYRRAGNVWSVETSFSRPFGEWDFANDVFVAFNNTSTQPEFRIEEKINGTFQSVDLGVLPMSPANIFDEFTSVRLDSDGSGFVATGFGPTIFYEREASASTWAGASILTRPLATQGLASSNSLPMLDFSEGSMVYSQRVTGIVRVFDRDRPFDTVLAEPQAVGNDFIGGVSDDGGPLSRVLNAALSTDFNANEALSADWSWIQNGQPQTANGLQAFVSLDPSVTEVTLRVVDENGVVDRASVPVGIESPPMIQTLPNLSAVDSDVNGRVSFFVDASNFVTGEVANYNWRWRGGSLNAASGIIELDSEAEGEVTLEVIGSNGLSSSQSFDFRLLFENPIPEILEPQGATPSDFYGARLAIDGDLSLIGAPFRTVTNSPNGEFGAAFVAQDFGGVSQQTSVFPGGSAGSAVIVEDGIAFVGGELSNRRSGSTPDVGRVGIYELGGSGLVQLQELRSVAPSIGALADQFGAALAKSGDLLFVGAPNRRLGDEFRAGAVHVYREENLVWTLEDTLEMPTPVAFQNLGQDIATNGDYAVATTRLPTGSNLRDVQLFQRQVTDEWVHVSTLGVSVPFRGLSTGFLGTGLAMNESELLIGDSDGTGNGIGRVLRYKLINGTWTSAGSFTNLQEGFGASLTLVGNTLVVGSSSSTIEGEATTYRLENDSWVEVGSLNPLSTGDNNLGAGSEFGAAVAQDGSDLIVGAPRALNSNGVASGRAYIFRNYAPFDPQSTFEPVADAGADLAVVDEVVRDGNTNEIVEPRGSQEVTLDASASVDRENAIVSYEWIWEGSVQATGVTTTARFPVGTTDVILRIRDATGLVSEDDLSVSVTLAQTPPVALVPTTGNSLQVNLPTTDARWRLASEFGWHEGGDSVTDVVAGETYQLELIGFPGSTEVTTVLATPSSGSSLADVSVILPFPSPSGTGSIRFPETQQGFAWRLVGESESDWQEAVDDQDGVEEFITRVLPIGVYRIEFRPQLGFVTPTSREVTVNEGTTVGLNWGGYTRIDNFNTTDALTEVPNPNLEGDPYRYTGMIRTPLGRGTGTVVADRVVLSAGHLFFDSIALQWANVLWFPQHQQGERQAPPESPRGILFRTSYAELIAPDFIDGSVQNLPEDDQEVDFVALYFTTDGDWDGGQAGYLVTDEVRNWLTGSEAKQAVGYAQRSRAFPDRGKLYEQNFNTPLSPLQLTAVPSLYETTEVLGDGGASGGALFVTPPGSSLSYPAAILLAGEERAVYRAIDLEVGRMIRDAEETAVGLGDVLDSSSSLVTFDSLGNFTTITVSGAPSGAQAKAAWTIKPNAGVSFANIPFDAVIPFNPDWDSFTLSFSAVSGFATPVPILVTNSEVQAGVSNGFEVTYEPLSGFDFWKQDNQVASDLDDFDVDGKAAILEYATDTFDNSSDQVELIRLADTPSQTARAEFEVYVSATAAGIRYEVQVVDDVTDFAHENAIEILATFTNEDGSSDYLPVIDSQPLAAEGKRFARVMVVADRLAGVSQ